MDSNIVRCHSGYQLQLPTTAQSMNVFERLYRSGTQAANGRIEPRLVDSACSNQGKDTIRYRIRITTNSDPISSSKKLRANTAVTHANPNSNKRDQKVVNNSSNRQSSTKSLDAEKAIALLPLRRQKYPENRIEPSYGEKENKIRGVFHTETSPRQFPTIPCSYRGVLNNFLEFPLDDTNYSPNTARPYKAAHPKDIDQPVKEYLKKQLVSKWLEDSSRWLFAYPVSEEDEESTVESTMEAS